MNKQNTTLVISAGRPDQFLRDPKAQVALSGRSNVGKSSLINRLLGFKKLARVSSEPGKTITVNFYSVDGAFYLVDLPGYGFARRSAEDQKKWSALADSFFQNNPNLRLVLQLVDLKVGPTRDDLLMLDFLKQTEIPFVLIATKADKLNQTERALALRELPAKAGISEEIPLIISSSKSGDGIDALWNTILRTVKNG